MPGRPLSRAELDSAIKQISKEQHVTRWPDPKDMPKLAKAVNKRQPTVELDGTKFKIRYNTKFGNAVFVGPQRDGIFVPCGYFNIDRLNGYLNA